MMRDFTQAEIEEEERYFHNVMETFRQYAAYQLAANNRRRKDLYTLPLPDQELLDGLGYKSKLDEVDKAIMANAEFLVGVIQDPEIFAQPDDDGGEGDEHESTSGSHPEFTHTHSHDGPHHGHTHSHSHGPPLNLSSGSGTASGSQKARRYRPTDNDMDKLRSTLKQFVRDWSEEGKAERHACYKPMQDALQAHFAHVPLEERRSVRVLVPGAGMGRLAWDIAKSGFRCQANEFSHYMLLSSHFILNRTTEVEQHKIYPYVHSFSNLRSRSSLLRPVLIPDVLPSSLPPNSDFSMVAGDFEEVYGSEEEPQSEQWDAVLTCFFIDTAKNIVNYLRILHKILAPGGVWINLGPLLWHFENNTTNDPSVELDLEDVKELARKIGFELHNEKTIETTYVHNKESMLGYAYQAAFWCATKKV
ncbi:N2227-domain-containing protein [Gloeophyllum trabeum ATCC 11539]|uniref:carnosine N-methyltransferase n=1 Tax=Gloeophyllum trabeum (strain ATCC 11539 / FP-39264 / Madison 617) TaxID=670483 RepID=S7RE84_GLOTA|nr:N2227-domain-containing protein [Gloeophyllum trabeum ATCC 11539]EPQ50789.1 N2227-domain-containing protein [Gloeophyllum trabeum ATCC 11539]